MTVSHHLVAVSRYGSVPYFGELQYRIVARMFHLKAEGVPITIMVTICAQTARYGHLVGGGFQYRYSRAFGGRIEVGHSHERNLIYVSITRGF